MATQLKKTTTQVKRMFIYFLIFVIVVLFIDWLSKQSGIIVGPDPGTEVDPNYPIADNKFQQIPKPDLNSLNSGSQNIGLISKTTAKFPKFPPVVYVYKIKPEREYLDDAEKGKATAKALGFTGDYSVLNNVMNWESEDGTRTFTFDRFQKYYKFKTNTTQLIEMTNEDQDFAIQRALSILDRINIKKNNLDTEASRVDFAFRAADGSLSSKSDKYNCVRVSLNKYIKAIEPVTNTVPDTFIDVRKYSYYDGIATLLLKEYANKPQDMLQDLIELEYKALEYEDEVGIYKLQTPDQAFQELQKNNGYLYRLHLVGDNYLGQQQQLQIAEYKIDPNLTKLIYIEPQTRDSQVLWTNFLQPFYLFEGTGRTSNTNKDAVFSFLVPALTSSAYVTNNP